LFQAISYYMCHPNQSALLRLPIAPGYFRRVQSLNRFLFVSFRCVVLIVTLAFIGENTVALRGSTTVGCFM
ncbi:MAG: hypothetical protein ACI4GB_06700, partial [Acutalibacteraceae bacterium]